ncbi:MAG: hypothetical protein C4288_12800 [Leptolyngbya sp. ERB_1_1]
MTLSPEQIENLLHASRFLLNMSKAATEDFDRWLNEHSWNLGMIQKALEATAALNQSGQAIESNLSSNHSLIESPITLPTIELVELPSDPTPVQSETTIAVLEAPKPSEASAQVRVDSSMMDLFRLEAEAQIVILNEGVLALEDNSQSGKALEGVMHF